MSIVEVRGLCKAFGDNQVLKNLDFQIEKGEVVTLIGPSGGGKTTLLRSLNWLNVPDAGRVTIDGVTIEAGKENKQQIRALREKTSMVFQHYNLWKNKTALENITEGLIRVQKMPKVQAVEKAEHLLERVGLIEKRDEYPVRLSGGQQQRVALARALIVEPKLCLLDEPFCSLDAALRTKMRVELKRLQQELGMTMVFVTHDQEEAIILADRIAIMDQGELVQNDRPRDLCVHPANEFVSRFMDLESLIWTEDGKLLKVIKP